MWRRCLAAAAIFAGAGKLNFQVRASGERMARNTPIQGTAADIIKLAMVHVWQRLRDEKLQARLLLQVHDELIVEAPDAEIDEVKRILKKKWKTLCITAFPLTTEVGTGKDMACCPLKQRHDRRAGYVRPHPTEATLFRENRNQENVEGPGMTGPCIEVLCMYVLGIESTCDETAAAIVENGRKVISNIISTSVRSRHSTAALCRRLPAAAMRNISAPPLTRRWPT